MSEIVVKTIWETGADMITDLVNQIAVGVFPAEWERNAIVHCCIGKWDSLEKQNYRGLKLTDQILKIAEINFQMLATSQWVRTTMSRIALKDYYAQLARRIIQLEYMSIMSGNARMGRMEAWLKGTLMSPKNLSNVHR